MSIEDKEGKLTVRNFCGFPELYSDGNLKPMETIAFLDASKEVVVAIEAFGKIFSPIVYDMQNNIQKITSVYEQNKIRFVILEELLNDEKSKDSIFASNAVLWLKRALELISMFFYNILIDEKETPSLKEPLKDAYEKTLKQYHRWIVQNTFGLVYRWIPNRNELFGSGTNYEDNMKELKTYQEKMHLYLKQIDALIKCYDLDDQNKV